MQMMKKAEEEKAAIIENLNKARKVFRAIEDYEKSRNTTVSGKKSAMQTAINNVNAYRGVT